MSPEDWLADRDPQLDKAIELLDGKSAAAEKEKPQTGGKAEATAK